MRDSPSLFPSFLAFPYEKQVLSIKICNRLFEQKDVWGLSELCAGHRGKSTLFVV